MLKYFLLILLTIAMNYGFSYFGAVVPSTRSSWCYPEVINEQHKWSPRRYMCELTEEKLRFIKGW